jgi:hypothetical protein
LNPCEATERSSATCLERSIRHEIDKLPYILGRDKYWLVAGYESVWGRRFEPGELGDATPFLEADGDSTVIRYPEFDTQLIQCQRLDDSLVNHAVVCIGLIRGIVILYEAVPGRVRRS